MACLFNPHNKHYLAHANPHVLIPRQNQVSFNFNVFCGILQNRLGDTIMFYWNVTSQTYLEMLLALLENLFDVLPLAQNVRIWNQQTNALVHNDINVNYLNYRYNIKIIATNTRVLWPAKSPDLIILDFYLRGTVQLYSVWK